MVWATNKNVSLLKELGQDGRLVMFEHKPVKEQNPRKILAICVYICMSTACTMDTLQLLYS